MDKFWPTVFLGPYLSRGLKSAKDSSLHRGIRWGYWACPVLLKTPDSGREGTGRWEECRSHHRDWRLKKGRDSVRLGGESASKPACLEVETFVFPSDWNYFKKSEQKVYLSSQTWINTRIRILWILRIKGIKNIKNYCSLDEREELYTRIWKWRYKEG